MYAAAYLRKSRSDDPTREVSREVQERAVRDLAARDGIEDLRLFVDWDRSGDDAKVQRRAAYQSMVEALRAGELASIYAYSADRLYRGVGTFHALMSAAALVGARIVTAHDGVIGGDGSPMAKAFSQIGAVFAELELNTAKSRAKAAAAVRRRRGDYLGNVPYGYQRARGADGVVRLEARSDQPVAPVLDAWERAGRQPTACVRILNDQLHLPASRGGNWDQSSLLRLIRREAPDRLPRRAPSGRRSEATSPALLAKLLRCHCGRTLTPNIRRERRPGRGTGTTGSYYCARGQAARGDHVRVYIAEAQLLPWVKAEAGRLLIPHTEVVQAEHSAAERETIEAKRARVVESYIEGLISKNERDGRLAELDRQLARLDARLRVVQIPPTIDWAWAPQAINNVLRELWSFVQLDERLQPVAADWLVPEWRTT